MMKLGRKIIKDELRKLDKVILDNRDKEIFMPKDSQETTIKTKLGEIPIARRRYKMVINGDGVDWTGNIVEEAKEIFQLDMAHVQKKIYIAISDEEYLKKMQEIVYTEQLKTYLV